MRSIKVLLFVYRFSLAEQKITYKRLGRMQTKDFGSFVGSFFARRAKKEPTKEEKHHNDSTDCH
jgi:hypothetical protein